MPLTKEEEHDLIHESFILFIDYLREAGVDAEILYGYIAMKSTGAYFLAMMREAYKAGLTYDEAVEQCVDKTYQTFSQGIVSTATHVADKNMDREATHQVNNKIQ